MCAPGRDTAVADSTAPLASEEPTVTPHVIHYTGKCASNCCRPVRGSLKTRYTSSKTRRKAQNLRTRRSQHLNKEARNRNDEPQNLTD